MEIFDSAWAGTADDNDQPPPLGFSTGEDAGDVKLTFRGMMGALKRDWNWSHPTLYFDGASGVLRLTPTTAIPAYNERQTLAGVVNQSFGDGTDTIFTVSAKASKHVRLPTRAGYSAPGYLGYAFNHMPMFFRYDTALDNFVPFSQLAYEILDEEIVCPLTTESGPVTAGAGKFTFRMPYPFSVTAVYASLAGSQTSGNILTVDIKSGGTSVLSTKLTIDNGEKTSVTAAAPYAFVAAGFNNPIGDEEITIDVSQIGDGTAHGLTVTLVGHQL